MISQLRGTLLEVHLDKDLLRTVLDVQGVGYEIFLAPSSQDQLNAGQTLTLFISESVTAFDGATTLYGFVSREEKDFFRRLRENVDGMGPRKALECLEKVRKSLPDFKRAVIDEDQALLVSVFGFTRKTAEKLVFGLKGKMDSWFVTGLPKWDSLHQSPALSEALSGLLHLGYKDDEARELLGQAKTRCGEKAASSDLLQEALRLIGGRIP